MEGNLTELNVDKWRETIHQLFGRRNRAFIPSRYTLISYLVLAIGRLMRGYRKGWPKPDIEKAVARVFGWAMAVADSFDGLPLSSAMYYKWGGEVCSYCHHAPCDCVENRPQVERKFSRAEYAGLGLLWTIGRYQQVLRSKYFDRNQKLGVIYALGRLSEESGEIVSLDAEVAMENPTVLEIEDEYALEISDVFGWLISVCNLLDIDLEAVLMKFYGQGCAECQNCPCSCGRLLLEQGRFHRAKPFTV